MVSYIHLHILEYKLLLLSMMNVSNSWVEYFGEEGENDELDVEYSHYDS